MRREASTSHAESSAMLADSCSKRVKVNQAQFQFAVHNSQFTVNERGVATCLLPPLLPLCNCPTQVQHEVEVVGALLPQTRRLLLVKLSC